MRILIVHEVSYLAKPVFEMHEFPEGLAERGHQVTFMDYKEGSKFWRRRTRRIQDISGRVLPSARIRLISPLALGIPGLDRFLGIITGFFMLNRIVKGSNFDLVLLYAVPTYGPAAIYFGKSRGIPVVFRALDVSHELRSSWFKQAIKFAERYVYANASVVSANNEAMAAYCRGLGGARAKVAVNFPPLDSSHFADRESPGELKRELGISESNFVLVYMGSFFRFSGLETIVRDFAEALKSEPNMKLLLIGGGDLDRNLRDLVRTLELGDSVIFTGFVPYERLPDYLHISNVAINPFEANLVTNTAFPHKVLQYLASNLPTISTRLDGLLTYFGNHSGIRWVEGPAQVMSAVVEYSRDKVALDQLALETNRGIAKIPTKSEALDSLEDLFFSQTGLER